MTIQQPIVATTSIGSSALQRTDPLIWLALVVTSFAEAEQALGRLSIALGYKIENGSLGNLESVRKSLTRSEDKRCRNLDRRIERWLGNRPIRNLLAHATVKQLFNAKGESFIVTRHLPRDFADVTPDRVWSEGECEALLRDVRKDGQSIGHNVDNLLADKTRLAALKAK